MPKISLRNGNGPRAGTTKYDAHHKVLSQTYGAFADLRRELSDSKATVSEREELLRSFATCPDSQRSWLLLEDYFEKILLSRKDFPDTNWWPRLLNAQGKARLEELAFLFLRAKRSVPPELQAHASPDRFARAEEAEQEENLVKEPCRCSTPRAPRSAWSAGPNRMPTNLRVTGWRCSFSSLVRAPGKKSARCAS